MHFFMSEYSEAELLAIKEVLPQIRVCSCDYYGEQAWECWTKDLKNGLLKIKKKKKKKKKKSGNLFFATIAP